MNIKELNFDYDLVRDHIPLTGKTYWINVFTPIMIWLSTVLQFIVFYRDEVGSFLLGVMLLIILALTWWVWIAVQGMKPIGKEGNNCFLKIKNGELVFKPNRFASERKIALNRLEKIDLDEKRILIKERGRDELFINLKQIQNPEKREEFIEAIKNLKN